MKIIPTTLVFLLALSSPRAWGQSPAPTPVATATPTFSVKSRLVVLDIVVQDKQGHPVTSLAKDDFTILDNGVEQRVRSFDLPASHVLKGQATDASQKSLAETPLTILLYDEINTAFEDASVMRMAIQNYLKNQPKVMAQPTMLAALNDTGFQMLANYTQDPAVLTAALKAHKTSLPSRLLTHDSESRLADTFWALNQLALATRGMGQRKNIIWIGNGFPSIRVEQLEPAPKQMLTDAERGITNLLLESRISISKIDPRANDSAATDYSVDDSGNAYVEGFDPYETLFSFNTFVQQTGGRYIYGRNDFEAVMTKTITNGSAYYTLSYSPSSSATGDDVPYHQISVRLRDPKLIAIPRQGYYTNAGATPVSPDRTALDQLGAAATSTMAYDALRVKVVQFTRTLTADAQAATCTIEVDGDALHWLANESGEPTADLLLAFATYSEKGKMLSYNARRLALHVNKATQGAQALSHPAFRVDTPLPGNASRLRLVVLQEGSGRIGSSEISPIPAH